MTSRPQARVEGGHASIARGESLSCPEPVAIEPHSEALVQLTGTVKWFDATRGFGFIVSEEAEGDILIHFSVLKEHDRRSLPEGATVECLVVQQERGLQARKVLSIDLSHAIIPEIV
ncbi:MAG TPA: cold shock domain-containing protein, partial [Allosphingosinicella sp.]|nr:cold shock domain-containing protein [Allosphingosinicella sp.]